jgi:DNA-binding transcriptional regulator of glucitol operon
MPMNYFLLLLAVVLGWMVQLVFTYRQSTAFSADSRAMRRSGQVSIGVAGRRYRGGRAFVAIAVDDDGIVRDAISLSGFTTFARSKPVPPLIGARINRVRGDREIPGLTRQQREAARQAASFVRRPAADRARQEVLG